ncbi:Arc family DNA-binding protein [Nitrosomonas sp.]|uniref:Arc family DNA-binding protein n=1 Tax=Nitrosomonas sp. TaxID=42353 RepID=UPI00343D618C|nr:hypothetical protein [Nitrosomonas sp.]
MTDMAISQDDFIKTALRLPRDLHEQIQKASESSGRSMNAEIISRLENSFEPHKISKIIELLEDWSTETGNKYMLQLGNIENSED